MYLATVTKQWLNIQAFGLEDKVELEIMINHNCGMTEEDGEGKVVKVSF